MAEIQGPASVLSWALKTLETYFSYSIVAPTSRWAWVLISLWQLDGNLLKIHKKWRRNWFGQNHLTFNQEYCPPKWFERQAETILPCTERIPFHQTRKIKMLILLRHGVASSSLHPILFASWWAQIHKTEWGMLLRIFSPQIPLPHVGIRRGGVGEEQCRVILSLPWRIYSLMILKCGFIHSNTSWL